MNNNPSARTHVQAQAQPPQMPMPISQSIAIQLRVQPELAAAVDLEVARLQAERFGSVVSRADVVREILARALLMPR